MPPGEAQLLDPLPVRPASQAAVRLRKSIPPYVAGIPLITQPLTKSDSGRAESPRVAETIEAAKTPSLTEFSRLGSKASSAISSAPL